MHCQFCGSPLPIDSLVCSYCKQRNLVNFHALHLSEASETTDKKLDCPLCNIPLKRMRIDLGVEVFIHHCKRCDGFLIDEPDLEKILLFATKEVITYNQKILRFLLDHPRHEKEKKPFYRKCPHCQKMMKKRNFKKHSGILIDKCDAHQLWVDAGELIQMLEWKKMGGEEPKRGNVTDHMTPEEKRFYYKLLQQ
jgi:Zn-finger nucleic acid-binding protein